MKAAHQIATWCKGFLCLAVAVVAALAIILSPRAQQVEDPPLRLQSQPTINEDLYERFKRVYDDEEFLLSEKVSLAERARIQLDRGLLSDTTIWLIDYEVFGRIELEDTLRARAVIRWALDRLPPDTSRSSAMWLQLSRLHRKLGVVDTTHVRADSLSIAAAENITGKEWGYYVLDLLRRTLGPHWALRLFGWASFAGLFLAVALWISRIKEAMVEEEINQGELAEKAGISPQMLSRKMLGKAPFKVVEMVRIADVLRRRVGWFFGKEGEDSGRLDFVIPSTKTVIRSLIGRWDNPEKITVPLQVVDVKSTEESVSSPAAEDQAGD